MKEPVTVTAEAIKAFKEKIVARQPVPLAVRFGVKGGACSGYKYVISYEDNVPGVRDVTWTQEDIVFVVDAKSVLLLSGSRVTWRESLLYSGFDFENPNEASRCGCGASFSPK